MAAAFKLSYFLFTCAFTYFENFYLMVMENNTACYPSAKCFILFHKVVAKTLGGRDLCSRQPDWQPVSLQQLKMGNCIFFFFKLTWSKEEEASLIQESDWNHMFLLNSASGLIFWSWEHFSKNMYSVETMSPTYHKGAVRSTSAEALSVFFSLIFISGGTVPDTYSSSTHKHWMEQC